jgi:L-ascorbate metabolism protein UlaG (beta-lactamase superfamily)
MTMIVSLGHSGFQVEHLGLTLLFDPWIVGNPVCPCQDTADIAKADYIFISHDHDDHGFAEGVAIAKRLGAKLVAINELAYLAAEQGVTATLRGNLGGSITTDDLTVKFVRAHHSCAIGTPCGFVVDLGDLVLYHAGDTDFFSDMAFLYPKPIDVAFLPIGSCFTMGPQEGAWAVAKIMPRIVIPMHYNTFPPIRQDPGVFTKLVGDLAEVRILAPGEQAEI